MPIGMQLIATAAQPLPQLASPAAIAARAGPGDQAAASTPFADLMVDAIGQVNQLEDEAGKAVTGLISGTGVDVHRAMIATEKAGMAFELALAVRNKAVTAYQSVIGMQF